MKRAIIVGSRGQDGRILTDQLAAQGYTIAAIGRNFLEFIAPATPASQPSAPVDILIPAQVRGLVADFQPAEIYYLAAFHHSAEDPIPETALLFERSFAVHVSGLLNFLDAARQCAPAARVFYAASSHVFGNPPTPVQNEDTPLNPQCIYGVTKTAAIHLCRFYRQNHNLFVSVGYLYNHESSFRRPEFLSQKIARAAVAISRGQQQKLTLGNLSATVDWGFAGDYTEAMARILALDGPDEFVIATGQPHTVRDFVAAAFGALGIDYHSHVTEDRTIALKKRAPLIGDATRLRSRTGWQPSISFEKMVTQLVAHAATVSESH